MTRVLIRARHVLAYQNGGHRHLRDGVVVTEADRIVHVGPAFEGEVDETVDLGPGIVTPGFINTHAHLSESVYDKSFVEDMGPRQFYLSGLYEYLPARGKGLTAEARADAIALSMAELLRSGTTTVAEIGAFPEIVAERARACGLRAYVGASYKSGQWVTRDGRRVDYDWFDDLGEAAFARALDFVGRHNDGAALVRGYLSPLQVDTCTEDLLRRSKAAAEEMGVPVALHAAQSVNEFNEIMQRHGRTPIEWLADIGFLGPNVILGHAIVPGGSSWANVHADDLAILADTGTHVAHAAWVFARRGIAMESFARYLARGINMTLATDTTPQSMVEALRWTAVLSKVVDRRTDVATAADVFNAATLGGARALGREDLGRIAPGAKADLLLWRGESLPMTPLRDPVRNIVFSARESDIASVMIDGCWVLRDGRLPGIDEAALLSRVQRHAERCWAAVPEGDWAGRDVDRLSPPSFPAFR